MSANSKSGIDPLEYLSRGWFPVNPNYLQLVRTRLEQGEYEENRDELLRDIKGDFALLGYCFKELPRVLEPSDLHKEPLLALRDLDFSRLQALLDVPADEISIHRFDSKDSSQLKRIKYMMISCSAAELLGKKRELDPEIVIPCAFSRQVGMTLIAFNYPRIFNQALSSIRSEGDNLEQILSKMLGYSPTRLGIEAMLGWNRNIELISGLGLELPEELAQDEMNAPAMARGQDIVRVCDLGDTLARLNDPETFPASNETWSRVIKQIRHHLGARGLDMIGEKLQEYGLGYQELDPNIAATDLSEQQHMRTANWQHAERLLADNAALAKCPEEVREAISSVYRHVTVGQVSTTAIHELVSSAIPAAGFLRGCVFLNDERRMRLVPVLRIGPMPQSRLRSIGYGDRNDSQHPAADAMHYSTPLRQQEAVVDGEVVSHVCGQFGNSSRGGVLYLEMSAKLLESDSTKSLLCFKAIRQALNDCLNLH